MKKLILVLSLFALLTDLSAQKTDKYITEKNVDRVIKALTTDEMMGRSAARPEHIEKATVFIEQEFKKIGLKPLKGLTSFRQEFLKDQVVPVKSEIVIDGQLLSDEDAILISEKTQIDRSGGLSIRSIPFDPAESNKDQYFFNQAFTIINDTTSSIITVAPEFKANFKELKGYFGKRFTRDRKALKVFVFGKSNVSQYSVKATQKIESIKMINVVGQLEGKTKPDEMVVFSGHYDHIGILQPVDGDSIANGADDDASGTTAVIELARYFKKTKSNNRTLVFAAFTAEEIGGFGSQYFSKQLNADKVVAMFNIEMIGKPSKWGQNFAFITGYERSDFGEILKKNLTGTQFEFKPDPYPEEDLFYRSDNATLARLGVPAHTISTDQIDIDQLYHSVNDEVESLDVKNITSSIRAIALSAKSIISGADTPTRIDKATVR
ncbi:MAG: M20/M25/M40 family metallo-hydrolase [Chryseolinea sp.]